MACRRRCLQSAPTGAHCCPIPLIALPARPAVPCLCARFSLERTRARTTDIGRMGIASQPSHLCARMDKGPISPRYACAREANSGGRSPLQRRARPAGADAADSEQRFRRRVLSRSFACRTLHVACRLLPVARPTATTLLTAKRFIGAAPPASTPPQLLPSGSASPRGHCTAPSAWASPRAQATAGYATPRTSSAPAHTPQVRATPAHARCQMGVCARA
jgi:hypothetical protein